MISSHGGDNMLARFEAGVNTFPHISQIKPFFVNHLYLLNEESQNVPLTLSDAGVWRLNLGRGGAESTPPPI